MSKGIRRPGDFCWINILTPRPDEARAFFASLLGWQYSEIPGMGHQIHVDGSGFGAIFDVVSAQTPQGTDPIMGVMLKVVNTDSTVEKIGALGGNAKPPFDIMDQGRMAVCFDPNGAEFDVWEPKSNHLTDVDIHVHGAPSWFETLTTDTEKARDFYAALFGWTSDPVTMPDGGTYTVFRNSGIPIAGMYGITREMPNVPAHWATYFTVEDIDATARDAEKLGGSIFVPVHDIEDVGRFCGIVSPQGVMFYAINYSD